MQIYQHLSVIYSGWEMQNNIAKCETLLQNLRQIYILENIFTYTTKLQEQNIFIKDETNLHSRKLIYKMRNTFTSPQTNIIL